jgi:hypothetical protein
MFHRFEFYHKPKQEHQLSHQNPRNKNEVLLTSKFNSIIVIYLIYGHTLLARYWCIFRISYLKVNRLVKEYQLEIDSYKITETSIVGKIFWNFFSIWSLTSSILSYYRFWSALGMKPFTAYIEFKGRYQFQNNMNKSHLGYFSVSFESLI